MSECIIYIHRTVTFNDQSLLDGKSKSLINKGLYNQRFGEAFGAKYTVRIARPEKGSAAPYKYNASFAFCSPADTTPKLISASKKVNGKKTIGFSKELARKISDGRATCDRKNQRLEIVSETPLTVGELHERFIAMAKSGENKEIVAPPWLEVVKKF